MGRSPQRGGDAVGDAATTAAFAEESDVHERLIQSSHHQSQGKTDRTEVAVRGSGGDDGAEEDDSFTHEELLHSIGSFSAVVWPVAVTMVFARWTCACGSPCYVLWLILNVSRVLCHSVASYP